MQQEAPRYPTQSRVECVSNVFCCSARGAANGRHMQQAELLVSLRLLTSYVRSNTNTDKIWRHGSPHHDDAPSPPRPLPCTSQQPGHRLYQRRRRPRRGSLRDASLRPSRLR